MSITFMTNSKGSRRILVYHSMKLPSAFLSPSLKIIKKHFPEKDFYISGNGTL